MRGPRVMCVLFEEREGQHQAPSWRQGKRHAPPYRGTGNICAHAPTTYHVRTSASSGEGADVHLHDVFFPREGKTVAVYCLTGLIISAPAHHVYTGHIDMAVISTWQSWPDGIVILGFGPRALQLTV